jgi:hypothetical protein
MCPQRRKDDRDPGPMRDYEDVMRLFRGETRLERGHHVIHDRPRIPGQTSRSKVGCRLQRWCWFVRSPDFPLQLAHILLRQRSHGDRVPRISSDDVEGMALCLLVPGSIRLVPKRCPDGIGGCILRSGNGSVQRGSREVNRVFLPWMPFEDRC